MESSSVCKDTNEVRDDKNLQTGQDVSNLLVQDEKLTSHLQMSALGNQQKEQILQQLDQLKRDLNKKFVPTEPVSEPDDLPDLENNQDSQKESNQEPQKEMSEGNFFFKLNSCVFFYGRVLHDFFSRSLECSVLVDTFLCYYKNSLIY